MQPIDAQCPHCQAQFRIKNPKLVGKQVRCPRCKQPFLVRGPTPEPEEASSLLAQTLAEEAAEAAASEPTSPMPTWNRSGSTGRHQYARRGSVRSTQPGQLNWLKPAILCGSVALGVVVVAIVLPQVLSGIGGGGLFGGGSAGSFTLAWLPPESELIASVRVAELWNSSLVQELIQQNEQEVQKFVQQMQDDVGLAPSDVDRLVFALPHVTDLMRTGLQLRTSGPAGMMQMPALYMLIVHTSRPIDANKILSKRERDLTHQGKPYHEAKVGPGFQYIYLPDDHTLVMGGEEDLKTVIDRNGEAPSLPKALERLDTSNPVMLAFMPAPDYFELLPQAQAGNGTTLPLAAPLLRALADSVAGLGFSLNVTDGLAGQVLWPCKSIAGAEKLEQNIRQLLTQLRTSVRGEHSWSGFGIIGNSPLDRARGDTPKPAQDPYEQLGNEILDSIQINKQLQTVEIIGTVPARFFERKTRRAMLRRVGPTLQQELMSGQPVGSMAQAPGGAQPARAAVTVEPFHEPDSPATTKTEADWEKKVFLSYRRPLGLYPPDHVTPLFITLQFTGSFIDQCDEYGHPKLVACTDDRGNVLRQIHVKRRMLSGNGRRDDFFEFTKFYPSRVRAKNSDRSDTVLEVHAMAERPAPGAVELVLLEGSLRIKTKGQSLQIVEPNILQKAGQMLSNPELARHGVTARVTRVSLNQRSMTVELKGVGVFEMHVKLVDGMGAPLGFRSQGRGSGGTVVYEVSSSQDLPPDTQLVILLSGAPITQTVTFRFENVPLPPLP